MNHRAQILEWAEQGTLPPEGVRAALEIAGVTPDGLAWRRFLSGLFLWLGVLLVASGVIFFFAYNWDALSRVQKFGLVEALLVTSIIVATVYGTERVAGQATLFLASLLTGAWLALIGQTYQTGADPYELFGWWALLILPWSLVARLPSMWLLFVLLLNLTVALYFEAARGIFGFVFHWGSQAWALFLVNTLALVIWEAVGSLGWPWLQPRWAVRIVAAVSGIAATVLGVWGIFESGDVGSLAIPAYAGWLLAAYFVYRHLRKDLFVLAGGVLSAVVVVASFLGHHMVRGADEALGLLFIGLVVIAMSAGGAWWLTNIAAGEGE